MAELTNEAREALQQGVRCCQYEKASMHIEAYVHLAEAVCHELAALRHEVHHGFQHVRGELVGGGLEELGA